MGQKVREVMTASPVVLEQDTPLTEAARVMREHGIGDVLVALPGGGLYGLATDRDIVVRALADQRDPSGTAIGDICTSHVVAVSPDEDADNVVTLMREHGVRRIPVTEDGQVVGIVTMGDMAMDRDRRSVLSDISAAAPTT